MPTLYPPTGHFPARPQELERDNLDATYIELRGAYRGLMVSRGVFRSKADQNRAAMQELETKLRAIAEREASVRQEAYEMLEIVTNVVGELEDAGDDLVNEFGLYQKGKSTYQGGSFIGRLIKAVATFIRRWTGTKQQLAAIVEKQQAVQLSLRAPMGKIAEALRANLRAVAASDARSLRELDQELRNATAPATATPQLQGRERLAALLGQGSFQQQTVATLKRLCKEHGITGYSKLRKAELAKELERHGVVPPPRPLENFKKAELIALVKKLLGGDG